MRIVKSFIPFFLATGILFSAANLPAGRRPSDPHKTVRAKTPPATIISPADVLKAISKHKGRVVVLHLWATWCMPCLDELPVVSKFAREMKSKGVELVSVSLDDPTQRGAERVSRAINERADDSLIKTIVRIDDPDAFISSVDPGWEGNIPALFAYDRSGRLRRAHVGEATRAQLDEFVGDLVTPAAKAALP